MRCKQKYCRFCQRPFLYDLSGNWISGHCKVAKHLTLFSEQSGTKNYEIQPLYCDLYRERKRKIDY